MLRLKPLKGFKAFDETFRRGKRFNTPELSALVVFRRKYSDGQKTTKKNVSDAPNLLLFGVTAKRRTRPAVMRNRIKRLLRVGLHNAVLEIFGEETNYYPFQSVVLIWNAIPQKPSLLCLQDVQPVITGILRRADEMYQKQMQEKR